MNSLAENKYINTELCAECGGKCCKGCGGIFAPEQFEDLSVEGLVKAVKELNLSIDWWEGCPDDSDRIRTLYLRVRNKGKPVIDPTWSGEECSALIHGVGCKFDFNNRPLECQALIPDLHGNSKYHTCHILKKDRANKKELSRRWIPYQDILLEVEKYF